MLFIHYFTFNPIQENTYIIYNDQRQCLIIDPGCYFPNEQQELKDFVDKNQLQPMRLINTHCHLDHVFGNKFIADHYQLELEIHEAEKPVLEYAPVSGLTYNMPFDNYQGPLHFLKDGDEIEFGEDKLQVLHTPGHSPGSISLYAPSSHFVVSGDVLFKNSVGRTDLPGGDMQTLLSSIRNKLFSLPNDTDVYSGHGPITSIIEEKTSNPFVGGYGE